jgi:hypothetical protein
VEIRGKAAVAIWKTEKTNATAKSAAGQRSVLA